ncbi:TPA: helix-turn-helix domain-containing protein [Salmonella enterica subsp. enterica serovar Birkenhead]|uniref:helix-turn-helix domain-containing protein n=1 Tax=Salmonella enterica TaxID=28901 RepID=UPI0012A89FC6|nr:helix-turn-helix domain-containing protein [Salmonella enterica]EDV0047496.1 helix-turn-helix domain-containing protein [Salmonella enterica subsp. enterica serovar Birkenhead]EHI3950327.1 helix-turn-helix domain-containing protein [Salmonella enterica]EHI6134849.1 helix-turn-helix domain-containing protein [Salmonella enterica]EHI7992808.1 helix-turn-helix domain-containing protein [Salmonella enterica]EHI7997389.1 helix-turn-helix domain-containing protein [Salmonella enterica]
MSVEDGYILILFFMTKNAIKINYSIDVEVEQYSLVILNDSTIYYTVNNKDKFYYISVPREVLNEYVEGGVCEWGLQEIKKYRKSYFISPSADPVFLINIFKSINSCIHNTAQKKALIFFVLSFFSEQKDFIFFVLSTGRRIENKVKTIIKRDLSLKWKLPQVASMLYMSPGTLKKKLKCEETSWTKILINCRMQKATELFLVRNKSVQQVAASCGYNNVSFFIRLFREYFGISPHEFIKKYGSF